MAFIITVLSLASVNPSELAAKTIPLSSEGGISPTWPQIHTWLMGELASSRWVFVGSGKEDVRAARADTSTLSSRGASGVPGLTLDCQLEGHVILEVVFR